MSSTKTIKFYTGNNGKYRDAKLIIENTIVNTYTESNAISENISKRSKKMDTSVMKAVKLDKIDTIDPPEIQDLDCTKVAEDKYNKIIDSIPQYEIILTNIMVEDTGLYIGDYMNGFPGAFVKYMIDTLSIDGMQKHYSGMPAVFKSAIRLNIGRNKYTIVREVAGHISTKPPSGDNGFGFDPIFVPNDKSNSNDRTLGEMSNADRLKYSARCLAFHDVIQLLTKSTS